jgi:hypothetical protein
MSQNIFKNPFVSSSPTLTGGSIGNGTLTVDRLTHYTIDQDYQAVCTAIAPFTVFKVIGALDGAIGVATVGTQFIDEDLKLFLTIQQGPTLFQIGDTFELSVTQGVDLNRENIDLYDELAQKNFSEGTSGSLAGDENLRLSLNGVDASFEIGDLSFLSVLANKILGNKISFEFIEGSVLNAASQTIQDLTYTADTPGLAGNDISLEYQQFTPGVFASRTIQDIAYASITPGVVGNTYNIEYVGGALAGAEVASLSLGTDIQVTIEDGVSTAQQIRTALAGVPAIVAILAASNTGTGLEAQSIQGPTFLLNGSDAIGEAGDEEVSVLGNAITVVLENGVSTAQQVKDAIDALPAAASLVDIAISGGAANVQTSPVSQTYLINGSDNVGIPGSEVVELIDGENIQVTFITGQSTAQQIKDAMDAVVAVTNIITIAISGVAGNVQNSNISQTFLKGGRPDYTFSFNSQEITDVGSFFEGNASVLVNDLIAQGSFLGVGDANFNGNVEINSNLTVDRVVKLNDTSTANVGPIVENTQKVINNLIQNHKMFLYIDNEEKAEWSDPAGTLVFPDDLKIVFPETNTVNTLLASSGPFVIPDGEHLYLIVDRLNNVNVSAVIASTVPDTPNGQDVIRLASRISTSLIWWDNTFQAEGKNLRIGEGGSGGVAFQEKIGTGNGATTVFPLTFFPTTAESILVLANSLRFITDDWTYNEISNQIEFTYTPDPGVDIYVYYLTEGATITPPSPDGVQQVEYRTISAGEITAKQLTLAFTPALAGKTMVDVIGGSAQHYGVDFIVSSNVLDWDGLGLEFELNANDVIRINYFS